MEVVNLLTKDIAPITVVALIVMYTYKKLIPDIMNRYQRDLQTILDEFHGIIIEEHKTTEAAYNDMTQALNRLAAIILYHDASSKGIDVDAEKITKELIQVIHGGQEK